MSGDDQDGPKLDDELEAALRDVPAAKGGADEWAHEGRLRQAAPGPRSIDAAPDLPPPTAFSGDPNAPNPLIELARKPQPRGAVLGPTEEELARRRLIRNGAIGLGGVVLLVVAVQLFMPSKPPPAAPTNDGALLVNSVPPGAEVLLGGQLTGMVTPAKVEHLPIDIPLAVSVRMRGYLASPSGAEVKIPNVPHMAAVDFKLVPARTFMAVSEPAGADVVFDGKALPGRTPLELPALEIGARTKLTVTLDGYVPATLDLVSEAATATIVSVKLDRARNIEVATEPPGAEVFVDDVKIGVTPVGDLLVPTGRKFNLRIERAGFKPITKSYSGDTVAKRLEFDLEMLPLRKLPLSAEEKGKLRDLERDLAEIKRGLATARSGLRRAEADLNKAQNTRHTFVADTAKIESQVERFRNRVEELEGRQDEVSSELDALREDLVSRFGSKPAE